MEGASGDDHEGPADQPASKKRYHRHTLSQIRKMEMFFKECPHPDEQQRQELGRELGLSARQVKFWFQNRRTQVKAHHERADNSMLRAENERLQAENLTLRQAMESTRCPECGTHLVLSLDEQQLRMENARLKEELNELTAMLATPSSFPDPLLTQATASGALSDTGKQVVEHAVAAMEEFVALARLGFPLWSYNGSLNQDEYNRMFLRDFPTAPFISKVEGTRDAGLVKMSAARLVDTLMQSDRWAEIFSSIVARASTIEDLTTSLCSSWNNALLLINAELQLLTPLVPAREVFFLRYCKRTEGAWAVVDASLNGPLGGSCCRIRPSGFFIEEVQDEYSKVTIVQHFEADASGINSLYRVLVASGMAFGATRWLTTLQRQAERLALAAKSVSGNNPDETGRQSMLKLAHRMSTNFCGGLAASTKQAWTPLSNESLEDVHVMTRKSFHDFGESVLNAATSLRLEVTPERLFDFLRDEQQRSKWDILSNSGAVQVIARISKSQDSGNAVSLLRVNALANSPSNMLILQETCKDAFGSLAIYAPVDISTVTLLLQGEDPACVALLPSGFVIFPDGPENKTDLAESSSRSTSGSRGSLLTVAFQIILPTSTVSLESVATVKNLISCTVQRIKLSLGCDV